MFKKFRDIADLPEDERIKMIGEACMNLAPGRTGAFITDSDPGKADRYIKKLLERFPELEIKSKMAGPAKGCISVIVTKKGKSNGDQKQSG